MILKKLELDISSEFIDKNLEIIIRDEICIKTKYSKIFGLGERYNQINQFGNTILNQVEEKFCNQGKKTYYPLPFFILDNGYAFFINTKRVIEFSFKKEIIISFDDLDNDELYIFKGNYKEVIGDFIELLGKRKQIPKWCFGPWISAHKWNSQKMVEETINKAKKYDIPFTVIVLEQWSDEASFYIFKGAKYPDKKLLSYEDFDFSESDWTNPKEMISNFHAKGIKILLWQCPVIKFIPEDEPYNKRHQEEWNYVIENKISISNLDGVYKIPEGNWFEGSMIPDFKNEITKKWWFNNRKYLLDIGVDGFKTDGGEFIYDKVFNKIRETEKELKNNYALEYVEAYSEFLGNNKVAFSRAGYIGASSYSIYWAGDQKSTFSELNSVYNAGINMSLCGNINWGFDIGGFSGELPEKELIYRAHQLGVFCPIMQIHSEPIGGQFSVTDPVKVFNNERTAWNLAEGDKDILNDLRNLYNLRMNLLPYIYSEYLKSLELDTTLMKAMFVEYEDIYVYEQYLFGELIVAPILNKNCDSKEVILPKGEEYYNIFSNKKHKENFLVNDLKLKDILVYIKSGTALVTRINILIPESIDNSIIYNELAFKLYGKKGSYRFVDENNDFVVKWLNEEIFIEGEPDIKISYEVII